MKRLLPLLLPILAIAADEKLPPFQMSIERLDPALDALIAPGAKVEKLAEGFNWSEGPTWFQDGVVFSDVPENVIHRWMPGETVATIFMKPSGMMTPREGFKEKGSNGLAVDAQGRLLICQHGERRVARVDGPGKLTAVADRFDGKRFNSPNDLAIRKNGDVYFTDPPYGLDGLNQSPIKELAWNGVYRVDTAGKVTLLEKGITFPNGIAFSPDEKTLYVAVSDPKQTVLEAFDVKEDGTLANRRVFFDAEPLRKSGRKGACDGLKVDVKGNVWATGPGGVLILSPAGKHLGTVLTNTNTGNCCFGGADGSELYVTADMYFVRVKTTTKGATRP
ncbi:MAG: SMP-30/gluconolactonase/LRE family protein [Chthoniobacteraceae bacterium]